MTVNRPAFVFDLDGTLIDSAPDIHLSVNRTFGAEGLPPLPLPVVQSFVGNGIHVLVARCMAVHGQPDDPVRAALLAQRLEEDYTRAVHLTTLYPGAKTALERLAGIGVSLGLCTNKPTAPTQAVLRHFGIFDHFSAVVCGDTLDTRKPDPRPLLYTQDRLGGVPIVFVGDSEVDADTAQAAGIPFWLFTAGYRKIAAEEFDAEWFFGDYTAFSERVREIV
jgi:phosphoglycolate phosphatase